MDTDLRKIDPKDFYRQVNETEKIKFLLKYAILAPSTHNTQPWLFRIKENSLELLLNEKRVLGCSDPTGRQALISLGCALKNLVLAAQSFHLQPTVQYLFQNDLAARIEFQETG